MLSILVCVKQVPDVEQMRMDPGTGTLIRDGVPSILNPMDANALSAAMGVKEKYGAEITLISMGPPSAESVLRECMAVGADRAVLLTDRRFGGADTLATSYSIAAAAVSVGTYDLIFCGKETLDGATGQMGPQLAEQFNVAQVTGTSAIISIDQGAGSMVVDRRVDSGVETLSVSLPCLLTIEKNNFPARIPTLKGKLKAKKAEIISLGADDIPQLDKRQIGDPGSPTKVPRMFPPSLPEPGNIIDVGSIEENVTKLLDLLEG